MTRILIVEDEPVIAELLEEVLTDHGFSIVAIASTIEEAGSLADTLDLDGALLDVNLGGQEVYPVARLLEGRSVPFAFTTGFGSLGLPPEWLNRPVFCKPYDIELLAKTLAQLTQGAA